MKHDDYKELIQLSVYDEITTEDKKLLEDHLLECEECSKEYESVKQLYFAIAENAPLNISEEALLESRDRLFSLIDEPSKKGTVLSRFLDFLETLLFGRFAFAVGSVTAVIIMLLWSQIGSVSNNANFENNSISLDELIGEDVNIANVRLPNNWDKKDEIKVNFDAVKSISLTTNLDDPIVKTLLAKSIVESENSWNRLQTLNKISDEKNSSLINDPEIKIALLTALTEDENPAVRKEAIETVKLLKYDGEIKEALLYVLRNDKNPGMRISAINIIAKKNQDGNRLDSELRSILDKKQKDDVNSFVRLKAASILERN